MRTLLFVLSIAACGGGPSVPTGTYATVDVAYGAFSVKAELLGNANATIGSSQTVAVDATRGVVTVPAN